MSTDGSRRVTSPNIRCSLLAQKQHGVVSRAQAINCGMSPKMIWRCLKNEEWRLLYPNVYLLAGAPLSWMAKVSGAVIGAGSPAAASHRSAAYLLGLDGFGQSAIEITTPRRIRWHGVIAHRGPAILAREIRSVKGVPTASANHTLMALSSVVGEDRLEAALDSALIQGLTSLDHLLKRMKKTGIDDPKYLSQLKRVMRARLDGQRPTESELERLYHRKVTVPFALREPLFQFPVEGLRNRRIDFAYPDILLGVEMLGWRVHGQFVQWSRDLARHNELTNQGWELLYFPWTMIAERPGLVAAQVREAIDRRTPSLLDK